MVNKELDIQLALDIYYHYFWEFPTAPRKRGIFV